MTSMRQSTTGQTHQALYSDCIRNELDGFMDVEELKPISMDCSSSQPSSSSRTSDQQPEGFDALKSCSPLAKNRPPCERRVMSSNGYISQVL
jgi:hypothetical protein